MPALARAIRHHPAAPFVRLRRAALGRCAQQDSNASPGQPCPGQHPPGHSPRGPAPALEGTCSIRAGTVPALGVPSGLRRPAHTGAPGGASRTRTERSRSSARCPHGPFWRRAQPLPGRPGVYPRSRQQGAPFRLGSRGYGGRRCAAPRRAALLPGPGRGRWMPRLRFCCLPGGLRRRVSAGRLGRLLGGGPGPLGRRGGLGPGRRAGGGARRLLLPHCPLEAAARTPGSGPRLRRGARRPGAGADREGRGGELWPLLPARGRTEAGQGGPRFGGGVRTGGSPGGPELRGRGCSLRDRGLHRARPRPPRPTERASEALRKAAGKASTSTEPFIPPSGLHPFTARPTAGSSQRSSC